MSGPADGLFMTFPLVGRWVDVFWDKVLFIQLFGRDSSFPVDGMG